MPTAIPVARSRKKMHISADAEADAEIDGSFLLVPYTLQEILQTADAHCHCRLDPLLMGLVEMSAATPAVSFQKRMDNTVDAAAVASIQRPSSLVPSVPYKLLQDADA